jgi:large subunit ribosomal protein L9
MKVILAADVPNVGKKSEVKDLSEGFVRNYLLPQKLVLPYTEENLRFIEDLKKNESARRQKEETALNETKHKLEHNTVTVLVKLGKDNKFFGAITKEDIARHVEKDTGVKVDRHAVMLAEPIRDIGVFPVDIRIQSARFRDMSVTANVKLWVKGT